MAASYRVLIVDDSALSREVLRRTLESDRRLQVVGEATTGEEAMDKVRLLRPHLVTMDLNMPGMGGLKAIEVLMREQPVPIVVISERSSTSGVDLNYEALSRGALELVPKSTVFGADGDEARRFVERLRLLAEAGLDEDDLPAPTAPAPPIPVSKEAPLLLGIGASTGGPRALAKLLGALPREFPMPIAVVQHMAEDFFDSFVRFLKDASGHRVRQAAAGMQLQAGEVYVAPPRNEMFVKENLTVKLLPPPPNSIISPSVDSLFFSMATALKGRGMGVLLTGMGDDGAQGLLRMRRMGARTVAQDRASCAVFGMPKAALELGAAEHVLDLAVMAEFLSQAARGVLPARAEPAPTRTSESSAELPRVKDRKRVLVLDESAASLAQARGILERAGYEVVTLDNPLMLARTLRRDAIDLVVLEPQLSTMKASVVVQTLRSHGLHVPIFLWTNLSGAMLSQHERDCQAIGAVGKTDPAGLIRGVGRALRT